MGTKFVQSQKLIWTEGKLVEVGGNKKPGIVMGIGDNLAYTVSVMVDGVVLDYMNPFWDGDIANLDNIADNVSVAPLYLLNDDPYYELLTHHYLE
tara:strand:- start:625 stop:909 length:285 start_codon:yes stop_codon:yes gene_type:complete